MVFEALYGPVYYGKTQKQERKEGVKRVKKVLGQLPQFAHLVYADH